VYRAQVEERLVLMTGPETLNQASKSSHLISIPHFAEKE
jgi:hypothetical protein